MIHQKFKLFARKREVYRFNFRLQAGDSKVLNQQKSREYPSIYSWKALWPSQGGTKHHKVCCQNGCIRFFLKQVHGKKS